MSHVERDEGVEIPFGPHGYLLSIRDDHHWPRGCWCERAILTWQRGCPTTGLPKAEPWKGRAR